ncbi:hypothetical protein [Planctomicrobium sp. SH664]|uniref:hypothetical protein n=1 Tax=Planctomicrobium sp. SH664 TaxID=3448125 RepID=UPI003F5C0E7E
MIEFLEVSEALQVRIGLKSLPHYSTLKKFADRSSVLEIVDVMLHELVQKFALDEEEAALDSTGKETSSASTHLQSCSGKQRTKYVKLSNCVLVGLLLPSGLALSWAPGNDKAEAPNVLAKAATSSQPKRLFADADYDAEWVHRCCREDWQVESSSNPQCIARMGASMEPTARRCPRPRCRKRITESGGWWNHS